MIFAASGFNLQGNWGSNQQRPSIKSGYHHPFVSGMLVNFFILLEPGLFIPASRSEPVFEAKPPIRAILCISSYQPFHQHVFFLLFPSFLRSAYFCSFLITNLLLSLELFRHISFPHAQTIAISALLRTPLSSALFSYHELFYCR